VHYRGQVVQVSEAGDTRVVLRVNVTQGKYGSWDDTIWVNYDGPRVVEDDIVQVWGTVVGRRTYTAVLGNQITIPEITVQALTVEIPTTPTPGAGIGSAEQCDELYELVVLGELDLEGVVVSTPPKGVYVRLPIQVTNLQSRTASLRRDGEFALLGQIDGRWLEFSHASYGVSLGDKNKGWVDWSDDLPPLVSVKTKITFDVNPAASDWSLLFVGKKDYTAVCEVRIPIKQAGSPVEGPDATSAGGPAPTATKKPAATAQPTKGPTSTPAMQLLADNQADFTGGQGQNSWEYLFSEGRQSFNWKQMGFDGSCYRSPFAEEQMRICPDHGAPGVRGDIAWLYKAEVTGKLLFKVTAHKVEDQGDDIEIKAYRHTNPVHTWRLDGGDKQGFTKQFELDLDGGEMIFFTMQVRSTWREFRYDPNAFRIQVYLTQ
jgi:hypothetical protein